MTTNNLQKTKSTMLVTGSEGSLAQWLIGLLHENFSVVGVDHCGRHGTVIRDRAYKFYQMDLNDSSEINKIFSDHPIDYVLHCAAQIYGVRGFHLYPADILSNNTVSTSNLLQQCVKHNVKKIAYISSSMVYENSQIFPLREEFTKTIPAPNTGYGLSKLVGERLIQEFQQQYGLKYVIWRPFNIVTPYEVSEKEPGIAHVMADFIQKIVVNRDPVIEIFGDGNQTRCFTNIEDIASIIAKISFNPITDNQVYNLGSETPTKIIDLAKIIHTRSKRQDEFQCKFVEIYNDDVKIRIPDCSRARALGFKHSKTIEELVDLCIAHTK
jgi:UDP-glucose 4-epimerase